MRTKKLLYVVAAATVLSFAAFKASAADGRLSIGAEVAMPMGTFGDAVSTGFGGSLRYEMPMGDNLGLTVTAGYITFSGKDFFDGISFNYIPVQVGAKYYFQEQQNGFYGMVELGIHSGSTSAEGSESSTDLSYAPALGYHLANIDIGLRYQMIATEGESTSYLGLRLAYVLGGK